jgi:ribosome-associated protein
VTAREERSQHRNRAKALERLREKLRRRNEVQVPRRATRVSKAQKAKRLEEKRKRAEAKRRRRPPDPDRE